LIFRARSEIRDKARFGDRKARRYLSLPSEKKRKKVKLE